MTFSHLSCPDQQIQRYQQSRGLPLEKVVSEAGLLISDIQETGHEFGCGVYDDVREVLVRGQRYAAKKQSGYSKKYYEDRWKNECLFALYLSHPNIVNMVGVNFDPTTQDPSLVMEYMDTSLKEYLRNNPTSSVSLSTKYSILRDVASGLLYLHTLPPPLGPLCHGALTTSNIMLGLGRRVVAKIADFGLADIEGKKLMKDIVVGSEYEPPETSSVHKPSNDIFYFGVTMLLTLTPERSLLSSVAQRRRKQRLDMISDSPVKPLITECLSDNPTDRPTTSRVFHILEQNFQGQILHTKID